MYLFDSNLSETDKLIRTFHFGCLFVVLFGFFIWFVVVLFHLLNIDASQIVTFSV